MDASLAKRIVALAAEGKSAREISQDIGVSIATLNNWKGAKASLAEAVDSARRVADELVVASLFRRAVGYSHPAVKMFYDKDRGIVSQEYTEHYAPDTTACIFWLKNRQRTLWSDETVLSGAINATIASGEIEALASRLESILRDTHGNGLGNGSSVVNSVAAGDAVAIDAEAATHADSRDEAHSNDGAALPTEPAKELPTNEDPR